MNAPSPQSSPPAGRGGVYLKIELKFQISLVRFLIYKKHIVTTLYIQKDCLVYHGESTH